jgi:hypothetical protein
MVVHNHQEAGVLSGDWQRICGDDAVGQVQAMESP